jgi:hypothetical protein
MTPRVVAIRFQRSAAPPVSAKANAREARVKAAAAAGRSQNCRLRKRFPVWLSRGFPV